MWPFKHNWASSYVVTYSFNTEILLSRSGREQRRARRVEPRRTLQTTVMSDGALDAWLWSTQAEAFSHLDPVTDALSTVRLPDTVTVEHPMSRLGLTTVTFAVEPGTDTYAAVEPDAAQSYRGRYVLPFPIDWSQGAGDTLTFPRQTVDFGAGRIDVTRPIDFGSRTSGRAYLRVGLDEVSPIVDFFVWARGRQRSFWVPSALDDLTLVGETVSGTITVAGDQTGVFDIVNTALRIEIAGGAVYYRTVTAAGAAASTTLLGLDQDTPDPLTPATVRRLSWLRVGRFASDDMSLEWLTDTLAQSAVQVVTLPYSAPETTVPYDEGTQWLLDYYGSGFAESVIVDPLDHVLNVVEPQFA